MATTYYVEIRNVTQDFRGSKPTPNQRVDVTRYCTRFNPDPDDFLALLEKSEWSGIESTQVRQGVAKPKAIRVQEGNWDVRIDWTEEWEEMDGPPEYEMVLGIKLYNVVKTYKLPNDRVKQIEKSYRMWSGDIDSTTHFQKLGVTKEQVQIDGTAIGRLTYSDILSNIKSDENVVGCSLTYNRETNTTAVRVTMEVADA